MNSRITGIRAPAFFSLANPSTLGLRSLSIQSFKVIQYFMLWDKNQARCLPKIIAKRVTI